PRYLAWPDVGAGTPCWGKAPCPSPLLQCLYDSFPRCVSLIIFLPLCRSVSPSPICLSHSTPARPSHPVVFLQFHPKPESKWTLVCRTAGFYPPPARLAWYQGSVRLPSTQPLQECGDPTGPLQASTTLDLPSSGPRATYTCQVMHPSLQNPLSTDYTYDPQHQDPPSLIAGLNLLKIALLGVLSLGVGLAGKRLLPPPPALRAPSNSVG
uniref:Ig-like domain-containing protein n=1 Tax=Chrysemys picta bellii TaxID=8478 RepID=A0A8C3IEW4_CHRPI